MYSFLFLIWKLRGLSPHFHIHVSVSDLYIPRIGPHISCSRIGRSIVGIYTNLSQTDIMWKVGLWPRNSFPGNICYEFSVLVLCSVNYCWILRAWLCDSRLCALQISRIFLKHVLYYQELFKTYFCSEPTIDFLRWYQHISKPSLSFRFTKYPQQWHFWILHLPDHALHGYGVPTDVTTAAIVFRTFWRRRRFWAVRRAGPSFRQL